MRYREDKPGELARIRGAVKEWREKHPGGTAGEMLEDLGGQFRPEYAPVLRAVLFRAGQGSPPPGAGITVTAGDDAR